MRIDHSVEIEAAPEAVWPVVIDVERWPEWTPTMESVRRLDDGPFQLGSSATIKQPQMPEAVWRVTAFTPGRQFTWETHLRGMRMAGSHELVASPAGCTSRLSLEVSGLVAWLLSPLVRRNAKRAMETENNGLRERCQRGAP
jgi:uncharacterized membrane protein